MRAKESAEKSFESRYVWCPLVFLDGRDVLLVSQLEDILTSMPGAPIYAPEQVIYVTTLPFEGEREGYVGAVEEAEGGVLY